MDNSLLKELASLPALLSRQVVSPLCCPVPLCAIWSTQVLNTCPSSVLSLQSCHCVTSAFLGVTGIIFLSEAVQAGLNRYP